MNMDITHALATGAVILTEGAVVERLRREFQADLDPHVVHAGFIYDPARRSTLESIYRQYIIIGQAAHLPLVLHTPTWRASQEHLNAAGLADRDVNGDCVRFLAQLRDECGTGRAPIYISGMIGPRGDAYRAADALPTAEAARYHDYQISRLAAAGVDFLSAMTLPALSEALGIARAMAQTELPYILSFVVRSQGALLDGTSLADAIDLIDSSVQPQPLGYMVNCVHPAVLDMALTAPGRRSPALKVRMLGCQANTSRLSPEALDNRAELDADTPDALANALWGLHSEHGLRILGGCCGTDDRYIRALADRMVSGI